MFPNVLFAVRREVRDYHYFACLRDSLRSVLVFYSEICIFISKILRFVTEVLINDGRVLALRQHFLMRCALKRQRMAMADEFIYLILPDERVREREKETMMMFAIKKSYRSAGR